MDNSTEKNGKDQLDKTIGKFIILRIIREDVIGKKEVVVGGVIPKNKRKT